MQDDKDYASLENIGFLKSWGTIRNYVKVFFIYAKQWKEIISV